MSRRSKQPSRSKVIAFKASRHEDSDILNWWERLPEGERSEALRGVIRAYLSSGSVASLEKQEAVPTQQIAEDTAWIRAALMELPGYLDRLVERTATARPVVAVSESAFAPEPETPRLEEEAIQRRRDKIGKTRW